MFIHFTINLHTHILDHLWTALREKTRETHNANQSIKMYTTFENSSVTMNFFLHIYFTIELDNLLDLLWFHCYVHIENENQPIINKKFRFTTEIRTRGAGT